MSAYITGVAILACVWLGDCQEPQVIDGLASHYMEAPTVGTLRVRQDFGHIPRDLSHWDTYIAVLECRHIGETWWLRREGEQQWLRALVFDCARRDDGDGARSWMQRSGVVVEVDYWTAVRWGSLGSAVAVEVKKPGD